MFDLPGRYRLSTRQIFTDGSRIGNHCDGRPRFHNIQRLVYSRLSLIGLPYRTNLISSPARRRYCTSRFPSPLSLRHR